MIIQNTTGLYKLAKEIVDNRASQSELRAGQTQRKRQGK